jgi:hypothetical protein
MKDLHKQVHVLADPKNIFGKITFIHFRDDKEHTFSFCENSMSGSFLAWFDSDAPDIDPPRKWVESVIRDIYKKSKGVKEHIGWKAEEYQKSN